MPTIDPDQQTSLPAASDPANAPTMMSSFFNLVNGIKRRLVKVYSSAADRTAKNPSPFTGELSFRTDSGRYEWFNALLAIWQDLSIALRAPGAYVTLASSQPITTGTVTPIQFTNEIYDNGSIWAVASPTNFVIPAGSGGLWTISGALTFQQNNNGFRSIILQVNGSTVKEDKCPAVQSSDHQRTYAFDVSPVNPGDVLVVCAFHNSGSTLNITNSDASIRRSNSI